MTNSLVAKAEWMRTQGEWRYDQATRQIVAIESGIVIAKLMAWQPEPASRRVTSAGEERANGEFIAEATRGTSAMTTCAMCRGIGQLTIAPQTGDGPAGVQACCQCGGRGQVLVIAMSPSVKERR